MNAPLHIFYVDDNAGDLELAEEALKSNPNAHLHTAAGGEEALRLLKQNGAGKSHFRPDIILLDLNMPKISGLDLLQAIKADASLKSIPVLIFTSSMAKSDLLNAYAAGANAYVMKPLKLQDFFNVIDSITAFWSKTATVIHLQEKEIL